MAITAGDKILASDLENITWKRRYENDGTSSDLVNSKIRNHYYTEPLPPRNRCTFYTLGGATGASEFTMQYYTRDIGTEDWTYIGSYSAGEILHVDNETDTFKQIQIYIHVKLNPGIGGNYNTRTYMNMIAKSNVGLQGENIRVMNESHTAWLGEGLTKVTVTLYNNGRLGYDGS